MKRKRERNVKLSLISMLSNPDITITDFCISRHSKVRKDSVYPWGAFVQHAENCGVYVIEIYKEPKK